MGEKPEITMDADNPVISLQRSFDAPRSRVFEAFTRAEDVDRWFKPSGFRLVECEIDLRVGGSWRVALRGPQGETHRLSGEYREIDAPQRLVQTLRSDDAPQTQALETLVFSEADGKTLLTSTITHASAASRDRHVASGLEKRAAQLLDRLADHLQYGDAAAMDDPPAPVAAPGERRTARPLGRIAAALAVLVALAGGGVYWTMQQTPNAAATGPGPVAHKASATGALVAVGAVALRAEVAGPIELVDCDIGGEVVSGTVCATIDERAREAARDHAELVMAEAEEQIRIDEGRVEAATAALDREKRKRRAGARAAEKAQAALDEAQQRAARSKTAFERATAAFESASESASRARIVSPIDGAVASRKAEAGATVAEGEELFVVAPAPIALQIEARVADPSEVHVGDKATFTVDGLDNRAFTGAVGKIGRPAADGADKSPDADLVVIDAPDPDHVLKPGMTAKVEIETGARPQ
ncbi:SRPBCC domain-containing protein [Methylosinus sp. Sm6]|uniref:SRPBCC domain-containing protein n=1 Tax=Methylosinus sp. Sm6 TaxID=2866948 RepID=UPI001C9905D4|nr:SRPBCC domain-containing protein [Methylosinus sp. Sm6]MBY6239898.1 SRPBCC domain-containing protein [Methylosinus sp. Sm6]